MYPMSFGINYYIQKKKKKKKAAPTMIIVKVLVKCRQNVANKLFITRVFNPVRPHTWLKELTRDLLFLSVRYMQNLHTILL